MTLDAAPVALTTPLIDEAARSLRVGQRVLLSGVVYTARDAAHQRLVEALAAQQAPPTITKYTAP